MATNVQTPSALKIIRTDFVLVIITTIILLTAPLYLVVITAILGTLTSESLLYIGGGLFADVAAVILIATKVKVIKSTFQKAEEIKGTIINIEPRRFNVQIEYEYTYRNEKYTGYDNISKSDKTKYYQKGDAVILVINPEKPNKAIIRDAYA
jgi:predicted small secreted protein